MNNISWRHHYIPQFYLKGFLNTDGKFKIYDVETQSFVKKGKDFSPESYFFEKHGNTLFNEEGADDFIETKYYARTDDRISKIFEQIRNATSDIRFGISENEMPDLQHFASIMFWRLPTNYGQIRYLLKTNDLDELGLLLKSTKTGEIVKLSELEKRLKRDPNFFKMFKYILPYVTYGRLFDCQTPLTIQTFPEQLPALCSDNPIIFENSILPDLYFDDFIFPLTHTLVLIRGETTNNILTTIKIDIDLILLKQAKKYVSCTDQKYIMMLNKYYDDNYNSLDELKASVFKKLIGL